ncbi:hypothetical protein EDB83DRAFT_2547044 [Lactarius deliciosus]|nr:hypothetical protein EDB83DRAFT_2547044 [Lactarius deliciosus]
MTVRVTTEGDTGIPIANADCPEMYQPVTSDPEGDILCVRPSHGHCGKICGCHHSYTSSYSIGSAFGAEAREAVCLVTLRIHTVHSYLAKPTLFLVPACMASNTTDARTDAVLGRKGQRRTVIRLHSGIVRWFGECVPEVAFVCPQAFGEPVPLRGTAPEASLRLVSSTESSPRAFGSGRSWQGHACYTPSYLASGTRALVRMGVDPR